jgi:hypothetical protein
MRMNEVELRFHKLCLAFFPYQQQFVKAHRRAETKYIRGLNGLQSFFGDVDSRRC